MTETKPLTQKLTITRQNREFVQHKVRPLWKNFIEFSDELETTFPESFKKKAVAYHRWMNIYNLKVAPLNEEMEMLKSLVKQKLQQQIDQI